MCSIVNELKTRDTLETIVCETRHHRQMLDQVLNTFNIIPDFDLSIMKQRQTLFDITIGILEKIFWKWKNQMWFLLMVIHHQHL